MSSENVHYRETIALIYTSDHGRTAVSTCQSEKPIPSLRFPSPCVFSKAGWLEPSKSLLLFSFPPPCTIQGISPRRERRNRLDSIQNLELMQGVNMSQESSSVDILSRCEKISATLTANLRDIYLKLSHQQNKHTNDPNHSSGYSDQTLHEGKCPWRMLTAESGKLPLPALRAVLEKCLCLAGLSQ